MQGVITILVYIASAIFSVSALSSLPTQPICGNAFIGRGPPVRTFRQILGEDYDVPELHTLFGLEVPKRQTT